MSEQRSKVLDAWDAVRNLLSMVEEGSAAQTEEESRALKQMEAWLRAEKDRLQPLADVAEAVRGLAERVEKLERQACGHDFLINGQTFYVNAEMMERIKALEESANCIIRDAGLERAARQSDGLEQEQRITALEAARPAHTAGWVDSQAEAVKGLAERVEGLEKQVEMGDLQLRQTILSERESRNKGWTFLANQLVKAEQRIAALEADNVGLRVDLDAANRRWDAWAKIVQPEILKVSQLDTERRLAEVERRQEGQG